MTTRMNTQNNFFKGITLMILALFISSTINAQMSATNLDFKSVTNSIIKRSTEEIRSAFEGRNEIFFEEEIPFEEWMMNLKEFEKNTDSSILRKNNSSELPSDKSLNNNDGDEEYEKDILIEEWMISYNWESADKLNPDGNLALEKWMSSPKSW